MALSTRASVADSITAAVNAGQSVSGILGELRDLTAAPHYSLSWSKRLATAELYAECETETPYGKVCKTSCIEGLEIYHVNPFALLYHAASSHGLFGDFLRDVATKSGVINLCYYLDKANPSEKRADMGRSAQCLYWSCLEFPSWFRSRRNGWVPFAYVSASDLHDKSILDSALVRFMVDTFDNDENQLAFSKGFVVRDSGGNNIIIKMNKQLVIADWVQHSATFSLKGHQASLPCPYCKNVMGRCAPFEHDYLVHFASPEFQRFDKHTVQSYRDLADSVKHYAEHKPRELKDHEQATGMRWEPQGIIYDQHMRQKLESPWCQYPDFMHDICASGGVGQYEVNGIINTLLSYGVTLADLDGWAKRVSLPKSMTRLPKCFFTNRVVCNAGRYIRAYASELLTAVVVIGFFLDFCVKGNADATLQAHIDSFDLLRIILLCLESGDPDCLPTLKEAIKVHHAIFIGLYHATPKLHHMTHITDFWEYWQTLLSCFGPERHHKLFKQTMRFAYKTSTKTALAYDVRTWIRNLARPTLYQEVHLTGSIRDKNAVIRTDVGDLFVLQWGGSCNTKGGLLSKNDLLQFQVGDNANYVGFVAGFALCAGNSYYSVLWPCEFVDGRWRSQAARVRFVPISSVVCTLPYIFDDAFVVCPLRVPH